jgi:hypothetical protein
MARVSGDVSLSHKVLFSTALVILYTLMLRGNFKPKTRAC